MIKKNYKMKNIWETKKNFTKIALNTNKIFQKKKNSN